jgi:hypothetical protein
LVKVTLETLFAFFLNCILLILWRYHILYVRDTAWIHLWDPFDWYHSSERLPICPAFRNVCFKCFTEIGSLQVGSSTMLNLSWYSLTSWLPSLPWFHLEVYHRSSHFLYSNSI